MTTRDSTASGRHQQFGVCLLIDLECDHQGGNQQPGDDLASTGPANPQGHPTTGNPTHRRPKHQHHANDEQRDPDRVIPPGFGPVPHRGQPECPRSTAKGVHDASVMWRQVQVERGQSDDGHRYGNDASGECQPRYRLPPVALFDLERDTGRAGHGRRCHTCCLSNTKYAEEGTSWM